MNADPGKLDRLNHALYPSLAMLAGIQLDVFSPLADGPLTAAALADRLGVKAGKLEPLLHALVIAELLEPVEGGLFANSPEAERFFVKGRAEYRGGAHELLSDIWAAALQTAATVRSGRPQAPHDFSAMDDAALGAFFRGLHGGTIASVKNVLAHVELSGRRHLLDVGGGSGATAITLCEAFPDLKATVLDLPRIAQVVTPGFLRDAGMTDRISVIAGDAVRDVPPGGGYDLVTMRALLQVLGPAQCAALVSNVAEAMVPDGRIVVIGRVLGDDRRTPASTALFNLVFLNVYEAGLAHTEAEHRAWLSAAGFTDIRKQTLEPETIFTARLQA